MYKVIDAKGNRVMTCPSVSAVCAVVMAWLRADQLLSVDHIVVISGDGMKIYTIELGLRLLDGEFNDG